jgi:endonuclease/exonuclease/phosphatase family metal-dependent hydrolase
MKREMPDVLGLNEVDRLTDRSGGVDQPKVIGEALGYSYAFSKSIPLAPVDKAEYGNALLTRHTLEEVSFFAIPLPAPENQRKGAHYEPRSVLRARIKIDGRDVYYMQTHFGLTAEEQIECVKLICELVDEIGDNPIIFAGDLNVTPEGPTLDPIRERLSDTAVLINGCEHTYPTHKQKDNIETHSSEEEGIKIDYIFVSKHFKPVAAIIPDDNTSDHYPYLVEVEF